jgi:hypothetical protein
MNQRPSTILKASRDPWLNLMLLPAVHDKRLSASELEANSDRTRTVKDRDISCYLAKDRDPSLRNAAITVVTYKVIRAPHRELHLRQRRWEVAGLLLTRMIAHVDCELDLLPWPPGSAVSLKGTALCLATLSYSITYVPN